MTARSREQASRVAPNSSPLRLNGHDHSRLDKTGSLAATLMGTLVSLLRILQIRQTAAQ